MIKYIGKIQWLLSSNNFCFFHKNADILIEKSFRIADGFQKMSSGGHYKVQNGPIFF